MKTAFAVVGFVVVALVVGTCVACNDDDDKNSWARITVASHEYDGDCDWDGNCGGYDERNGGYGDGRGGDGRFGGGRSGDYDGGDGDGDRCRNICNNTFPIAPSPGGGEERPRV